jgi:DNA-binding MarR family transcriptional regulator
VRRSANPDRIADELHSACIHFLRRVAREDEESGLSPARLSALSVVVFAGPLSLGELAAAERVRPPTMTRIVSGLEADGLVRRAVSPSDRRVTPIRATPKGQRVLERARARRLAVIRAGLSRLGRADLAALERSARVLEEIAQEG